MGGEGSGRRSFKKPTVEECLSIDTQDLKDLSDLTWMLERAWYCQIDGNVSWYSRTLRGYNYAKWSLEIDESDRISLCLMYQHSWTGDIVRDDPEMEWTRLDIDLVGTRIHFGGVRWWFVCPFRACSRRVKKLYKIRDGKADYEDFGCRSCLNLTYHSSQKHDKRVPKSTPSRKLFAPGRWHVTDYRG